MTDSKDPTENKNSFSLTKKNAPFTWQESAYERLKVLYSVSKILSSFKNAEKTFPEILTLCSTIFPLVTAVMIEKFGKDIATASWHAGNATEDQIEKAMINAKKSFIYLTEISLSDLSHLASHVSSSEMVEKQLKYQKVESTHSKNYLALPLVVDGLPAHGVFQLEGAAPLSEVDLEFVDALTSLIAVAIDRHHKTRYELEMREREAQKISSKLNQAKEDVMDLESERELRESFVSLLSHDLCTPLSAARISAQLIQQDADDVKTTQVLAARIVSNVNRADQMISELLDANRIRSGEKLPLIIEPVDLCALTRITLNELVTIHGDRFILKAPNALGGYWDSQSLRRILENLCNNAIKYGFPSTPVILTLSQDADKASIQVQNSGDPISPKEQETLFQQFRRGDKVQSRSRKGWGIGLTLVRAVAEAHGGNVNVQSNAELGTVFTVTIPRDARSSLVKI
jgi:signal transduction histidine kinase